MRYPPMNAAHEDLEKGIDPTRNGIIQEEKHNGNSREPSLKAAHKENVEDASKENCQIEIFDDTEPPNGTKENISESLPSTTVDTKRAPVTADREDSFRSWFMSPEEPQEQEGWCCDLCSYNNVDSSNHRCALCGSRKFDGARTENNGVREMPLPPAESQSVTKSESKISIGTDHSSSTVATSNLYNNLKKKKEDDKDLANMLHAYVLAGRQPEEGISARELPTRHHQPSIGLDQVKDPVPSATETPPKNLSIEPVAPSSICLSPEKSPSLNGHDLQQSAAVNDTARTKQKACRFVSLRVLVLSMLLLVLAGGAVAAVMVLLSEDTDSSDNTTAPPSTTPTLAPAPGGPTDISAPPSTLNLTLPPSSEFPKPTLLPTETAAVQGDLISGGESSGSAVSLSNNGMTVAIGAPTAINMQNVSTGIVQVHQYENMSWTPLGGVLYGEKEGDLFGTAVVLSGDKLTLAIGVPGANGNSNNIGYVRVYGYGATGGTWNLKGDDVIYGESEDERLGMAVSLSGNGNIVAVAAVDYIRVFENRSAEGGWTKLGRKIAFENRSSDGGWTVSLSHNGTSLGLGAPGVDDTFPAEARVDDYNELLNVWSQRGPSFGVERNETDLRAPAVSLSGDGTKVAVGSTTGQVKVFVYSGLPSNWTLLGDEFPDANVHGQAVSMSGDGRTVAFISASSPKIFHYEENKKEWLPRNETDTTFTWSTISLAGAGQVFAVGNPSEGKVAVFQLS